MHLERVPEVLRCQRETRQWFPVTLSYLGISSIRFPHSLELRHQAPVQLREPYDLSTFWQVFLHRCYAVNKSDQTIIDAGANIGLFALYAAREAPESKILAIEPFPATFERLEQAIGQHGLNGRVECLNCALCGSDKPRTMRQTHLPSQMQRVTNDSREGIAVPAQTLLQVMDRIGGTIDLVKMDIEGSEYEVLSNTAPKQLKRIRRLVLEYHGTVGEHNPQQLLAYLAEAGFRVRSDHHDKLNYGVVELVQEAPAAA
jgi:FkbM family methyltransferase